MKQKSIAKPFSLAGIGLHSGEETCVNFSPAPPDSGIYFLREGEKINALLRHVSETKRGTTLAGIATVEHLLAAIYGLGIDNLEIEVKGRELPALDGSSLPYLESFLAAGIADQKEEKHFIAIEQPIKISEGEASLCALPSHGFKIDFMVNFQPAGEQRFVFDFDGMDFKTEIAPARTFGYIDEYEKLKKEGLARGASLENALVLGKEGYVNPPRFPDEMVRHKILDLVGDLSLLGKRLKAEIKAVKSGHKLNLELARRILKHD